MLAYQSTLLDYVSEAVLGVDEQLIINFWNEAAEKLFGFTSDEVIGQPIREVLRSEYSPDQQDQFRALIHQNGQYQIDGILFHRDGRILELRSKTRVINREDGTFLGYVTTVQDLTELKRQEAEIQEREARLRASEAKYRTFFEHLRESVVLFEVVRDDQGNLVDLIARDANPPALAAMGLEREQALNRRASELFPIEALERAVVNIPRLLETGEPWTDEQRIDSRYYRYTVFRMETNMVAVSTEDITERKQAETVLQESERRLRDFLDNTHDICFILDHDWCVQFANRHFTEIRGLDVEELIGKDFWEVFPRYIGTTFEYYFRKVMTERTPVDYETSGIYSTGWYEVSVYPTQDGISVFAIDRTSRKIAQEELQAAYARLRFYVDSSIVGVTRGRPDGKLIEVNDYFLNLVGYTRADFEAGLLDWRKITPPEHLPSDERAIAELEERRVCTPYEKEYYRKDGSRVWVHISIALEPDDTYAAFLLDISERKQAEEALQESESRFRHLANAMPQLVWTATADGRIDYLNQRHQEYDGVTLTEDGVWDWTNGVHPDDLPLIMDRMKLAVQTGIVYETEFRILMADGTYRWHLSRGVPIKDRDGNIIRWLGTNTDIENQKQAEERLRRSNQELEQFAFVASHDLQEPLRKIKQFGITLQRKLREKLDGETRNNFDRMINASERMQMMIEDLLDLSRVSTQGQPFVQVDLSQILSQVTYDLEPRIQRTGGRVIYEKLPTIEADPIQMQQVFQNLIGNALKFHKPDVPPLVKVSSKTNQTSRNKRQMVSIFVEDNGIGFDNEQSEAIMQPFRRLHGRSEFEGTGIGLAIVKKIIERHQGEISAQSTPGVGSTFIITLPVTHSK